MSGSFLYSGVHLSTDAGVSWSNYGFSLPTKSIAIDSSGYIFAGTNQQGIFRTAGRVVPVDLISFTAKVSNKNVILSWITATETNNYGFEIERKQSIIDWTKIGFIQGNGTTIKGNIYNYADENIETGEYYYRLKQIDYDGSFEYSPEVQIKIEVIYDFNLEQNYPNPFNPTTTIEYSIPEASFVELKIYDILGGEVASLVKENKPSGKHSVKFNASNLPSGIYFYRIVSGNFTATKKLILLK
ncbi:MAG: T9SS type A sorting domain-containing protein [Bacteroidetes bacterium]|nr:T9SS type A sorting domain-containing protein [Bacteroidota bacterium]